MKRFVFQALVFASAMASGRLRRAAALEARDAVLQLFSQDEEGESASDQSEGTVAHIADIHGDPNDIISDEEDTAPVAEILPQQEPHPRTQPRDKWTDKNGNTWSTEAPPYQGRRGNADILRQRPGPTRDAVKNNIVETWNIFIPDDMLQKIVRHSQEKASALGFQIELTVTQLKAFIGILYFRGANGDQHIPANDLWSSKYSIFYRAAMSRNLFNMWSRCLRFDNSEDRQARKVTDTYAAFRDLWEEWNARLRRFFVPGETITIDEQLVATRCRSPHRIYCPKKPGKYGELVRWACDAESRYFLNGNPRVKLPANHEAARTLKEENKAKNLVLTLSEPYLDAGRNITVDRFFCSQELAEELLRRRTTLVGTLATNKRHIPAGLMQPSNLNATIFCFGGPNQSITQVSHQYSRTKKVYLLSTLHHSTATGGPRSKSEIQLYYNATKAGVDAADQLCKSYTTRTATRRWPVVHFHNVLDVTAINAMTIYDKTKPNWCARREGHRRREFLVTLATDLAIPHMRWRSANPIGLQASLVSAIRHFTGEQLRPAAAAELTPATRVRCTRCLQPQPGVSKKEPNKTSKRCNTCHEPVCGTHSTALVTCNECLL